VVRRLHATAKSVGTREASAKLAARCSANGLQRLLDAERANGLITNVFRASRNQERDQAPGGVDTGREFERKAKQSSTALLDLKIVNKQRECCSISNQARWPRMRVIFLARPWDWERACLFTFCSSKVTRPPRQATD